MIRRRYSVGPIEPGEPDDLWLGAVSFEPRCANSARLLSPEYSVGRCLLFRYRGPNEQKMRDRHQSELCALLSVHLPETDSPDVVYCDKDDALDGVHKLEVLGLESTDKPLRITVDLTTFTKQYLLTLLRWLDVQFPNARVRTLYTAARYWYPPRREPRLTWGVKALVIPPFYGGSADPELPDLAVIFLGYEAERAYRVWRTLEPEKTIAVIGYPPIFPGAEITARVLNKRITERPPEEVEMKTCAALDPEESCKLLCELAGTYQGYNMSIVPLGSKMQTLGTYLFFRTYRPTNAQVVYAIPGKYDEAYYSVSHPCYAYEYHVPSLEKRPGALAAA